MINVNILWLSFFFLCITEITLVNFELIVYTLSEAEEQDSEIIRTKKLIPLYTHKPGSIQPQ